MISHVRRVPLRSSILGVSIPSNSRLVLITQSYLAMHAGFMEPRDGINRAIFVKMLVR